MHGLVQIAPRRQVLSPEKPAEVLDVVAFLVSRQSSTPWTIAQRREIVPRMMGCLRQTRTSRQAFAQRPQEENAKEELQWIAESPPIDCSLSTGGHTDAVSTLPG